MSKICKTCKIEKSTECFSKSGIVKGKQYHRLSCKDCLILSSKKYYYENRHKYLENFRKYREKNKGYFKQKNQEYYLRNREADLLRQKAWKEENKDHLIQYRKSRKKEANEVYRKYKKERYHKDPVFRLKCNLRRTVSQLFSGKRKSKKTLEMLGCSFEEAKAYIEAKFKPGMSWDNYGKWHIDHIVPLSSGKNEEELIKICHYSNLQPLWALENILKSNKMPLEEQQSLGI